MQRPRIPFETMHSWDDIPPADQEKLLLTWREFMAADCMNDLSAKNYLNGQMDDRRFSEKHAHVAITFAWRSLLIGYWLGKAAQSEQAA